MKLLCLAIFAVCIAIAVSETCTGTDTSTCIHTICDSTTQIMCVNGACTCENKLDLSCTTRQNCLDLKGWNCQQEKRHCIDNMCRCTRV